MSVERVCVCGVSADVYILEKRLAECLDVLHSAQCQLGKYEDTLISTSADIDDILQRSKDEGWIRKEE